MASRRRKPLLTDQQWEQIEPLLPPLPQSKKGGHPWTPNRPVLEGILWVLRTGARWQDSPDKYPSPSTCWRRLQLWEEQGVWLEIWRKFWAALDKAGQLDWSEAFADGSFASAKKGGPGVGKTKRGKGTKWMVVVDGQGVPLGGHLGSASPAEVNLLEPTLATIAVPRAGPGRPRRKPERVIADKAYDSDPLRVRLAQRGIELTLAPTAEQVRVVPHRRNRQRPPTQDGRKLRRYRRRWKVERTFAWLGNFRRLVVRWERHLTMYRAFFHLACLLITLSWLRKQF
jgi:transposase